MSCAERGSRLDGGSPNAVWVDRCGNSGAGQLRLSHSKGSAYFSAGERIKSCRVRLILNRPFDLEPMHAGDEGGPWKPESCGGPIASTNNPVTCDEGPFDVGALGIGER